MVSERASDEGPDDGRETEDGAEEAKQTRPIFEASGLRNDLNRGDD